MTAKATKEPSHTIVLLDPKDVKVGWRARKDDGDITELAESIGRIGQLHPIIVRLNKEGAPVVIAGLRRLRACRSLGVQVQATVIAPEDEITSLIVQLEENVKRKDFDKLEVGEGLKRFKLLYEKKHGVADGWNVRGDVPRDSKGRTLPDAMKQKVERFTVDAARSLGVGKTLIYDLLGIASLPEEDKKEIEKAKTTRERNVAATKALSKVRQQKKLSKLEAEGARKAKAREKAKPTPKKEKGKATTAAPAPAPAATVVIYEESYKATIKRMQKEKAVVDLVCTDPPYDLERNPILHTGRATINDQALAKWDRLDIGWVIDVAPVIDAGGSLVVCAPLELLGLYKVVCARAGLTYRGAMVWHKTNPAPAHRSVYSPAVEAVFWATKGDRYFFKPWVNAGTAEAHNFFEGPICGGNERLSHPAQKPLWLIKRLVERHAGKAAMVFDPFMGTGTTLVACAQLGLRAAGAEVDTKYFKMAKTRLAAI